MAKQPPRRSRGRPRKPAAPSKPSPRFMRQVQLLLAGRSHAARRGRRSWPVLMALGGWKTERMIRRYASVTDSTLRAAANAVAWEPTAAPWQQPRKAYP
jgi:hypothetical protein